jgi:predicted transcriptional regulator
VSARVANTGGVPPITDLELKILGVIWAVGGEATVQSILDSWPERRRPGYTTVLKTLQKMETKGAVTHRPEGRAYVYRPTVARDEVTRVRMGGLRDALFRRNPTALVATFLKHEELTREDLDELRRMIDDYEMRLH